MENLQIQTSTLSLDNLETEQQLHNWVNNIYPEFYHWMVNKEIVSRLAKKKIEVSSPVKRISIKHNQDMEKEIDSLDQKYDNIISWMRYHLIHLTRLISYYRKLLKQKEVNKVFDNGVICHSPPRKRKFNIDLNLPTLNTEFIQKESAILQQFQTLLFISNKMKLQEIYDKCLLVKNTKSKILDILQILEAKKKELDEYYQDHFKILKQSKKKIRQEHLEKLEQEKKKWIEDNIEFQIDEILRTQYRHGPKIEKEGKTINTCWKEELVDFHQNFWEKIGSTQYESFEEYLIYLERKWNS